MLVILAVLLLSVIVWYCWNNYGRLPGPWCLPILGYLPWIDSKKPHITLTELSRKYGPIYGLRMGSIYTVVLTDVQLIRKLLMEERTNLRAPLYLTHGIMHGYGLICAEGERWKDQRKFVTNSLRRLGATKASSERDKFEDLVIYHVDQFINRISDLGDQVRIDPSDTLQHNLGSIINRVVFGKAWLADDPTWHWIRNQQNEALKYMGIAGVLNFLPFLRYLPSYARILRFLCDGKIRHHRFYQSLMDEAGATRQTDDSILALFLTERARRHTDSLTYYDDIQCHHLLADMFGAGLDTTLVTLRWTLLYLATRPDFQQKIRDQLESIGQGEFRMGDLAMVPALEAAVAESQRLRPVVPLGMPHGISAPITIANYRLPAGAMIVPLQWAIHTDPTIWYQPFTYRPERFLNDDGQMIRHDHFIPFQIGKRICVGEEFAKIVLYHFVARILKQYRLECDADVDLEGDCGFTLAPKPHELVFIRTV